MAKAFKCDFCNKYYEGSPNVIYFNDPNGNTINTRDACDRCLTVLNNIELTTFTGSQKEVDET